MSVPKWCYYVVHKCPDCGRTWEEYDASGGSWDSGLSSSPVVEDRCEECAAEAREEDLREDEMQEIEALRDEEEAANGLQNPD